LVHSAGVIFLGPFEKVGIENLDEQYRINVRAPYLLTQKLLPTITKSKGQIVFVNSTAGLSSWENNSQYSASKHALRAVADSLRKEVASSGVKVMSVFPGATDTPMQKQVQQMEGNEYDPDNFLAASEVARTIITSISLPQNSMITEITIRPNKYSK
jgi:NADP-dependent 3-hydroxy acid dehydrogenase YdfG